MTEVVEFIRFTLTRWNHTIVSIDGNNIDMGTYDIRVFKGTKVPPKAELALQSSRREDIRPALVSGTLLAKGIEDSTAQEQSFFEIKIFTLLPARGIWEDYYETLLYKIYYQSEHRDQLLDAHFDKF